MWIFAEVSLRGFLGDDASNDSGVIKNVDFQGFGRYVFGALGNETNIISII